MTTYPDSVQFLYTLGNEVRTVKLGLERIRALLAALGNPQDGCRFVHVAGTNGKGSTCAMIEAALRQAGLKTGLFTSPHLVEPTERIRISGAPVAREEFARAFETVHGAAEELLSRGLLDLHPTYFETVTAMAFVLFRQAGVECAALEVGLGGRLDATNLIQPAVAVITPVDFDHEAYLGRGLDAIAGEKAGILKAGAPAVIARQRPEAEAILCGRAAELGVPLTRTADWRVEDLQLTAQASAFTARGPRAYRIHCPLAGEHQVENALTAVAALDTLGIPPAAIEEGIPRAQWPGRLERVSERPEIILDGAHNPAGARALAAHLERFYRHRRITLVYGAMRDKAVEESSGILFPLAAEVVLTAPAQARAVRPETVREMTSHPRVRVAPRVADALALARDADLVVVAGSLFLVGEARALLVE